MPIVLQEPRHQANLFYSALIHPNVISRLGSRTFVAGFRQTRDIEKMLQEMSDIEAEKGYDNAEMKTIAWILPSDSVIRKRGLVLRSFRYFTEQPRGGYSTSTTRAPALYATID